MYSIRILFFVCDIIFMIDSCTTFWFVRANAWCIVIIINALYKLAVAIHNKNRTGHKLSLRFTCSNDCYRFLLFINNTTFLCKRLCIYHCIVHLILKNISLGWMIISHQRVHMIDISVVYSFAFFLTAAGISL